MSSDRLIRRFEKMIAASVPPGVEVVTPSSRDGWLGQRGKTIGASEAPALLGASPFESYYDLWCRKAGLVASTVEDTGPVRRGRMLEAVAVEFLREEHPDWVVIANPMPGGRFYRDGANMLSCTPDVFILDPLRPRFGLGQVKSVQARVFREQWVVDGEIEPPLHVAVQVVQELALTGAAWAVALPLVVDHGIEMPEIDVPPHPGLLRKLRGQAAAFWTRVEAGLAPQPDFLTDGGTIAALYPEDNGTEIDLSSSNELPALADELDDIRARGKADEARAEEIKARFRYELKAAESALLAGGRRVTLRTVRKAGHWIEPTQYRQLRFSRPREK